jgi:hypothetical protein
MTAAEKVRRLARRAGMRLPDDVVVRSLRPGSRQQAAGAWSWVASAPEGPDLLASCFPVGELWAAHRVTLYHPTNLVGGAVLHGVPELVAIQKVAPLQFEFAGPRAERKFGDTVLAWSRPVCVLGWRYVVGVSGSDKRYRIAFSAKMGRKWFGFVRDAGGRDMWTGEVSGSIGAAGLLLAAGLIGVAYECDGCASVTFRDEDSTGERHRVYVVVADEFGTCNMGFRCGRLRPCLAPTEVAPEPPAATCASCGAVYQTEAALVRLPSPRSDGWPKRNRAVLRRQCRCGALLMAVLGSAGWEVPAPAATKEDK